MLYEISCILMGRFQDEFFVKCHVHSYSYLSHREATCRALLNRCRHDRPRTIGTIKTFLSLAKEAKGKIVSYVACYTVIYICKMCTAV